MRASTMKQQRKSWNGSTKEGYRKTFYYDREYQCYVVAVTDYTGEKDSAPVYYTGFFEARRLFNQL
jgi:hypothetical protein